MFSISNIVGNKQPHTVRFYCLLVELGPSEEATVGRQRRRDNRTLSRMTLPPTLDNSAVALVSVLQ